MVERLKRLPSWGVYALLIYMPLHIFLSQWLSLATGGLSAWKVAKDVVTMILLTLVVLLVLKRRLQTNQPFVMLMLASAAYLLLHVTTYQEMTTPNVAALAITYNNRVFWYALLGLGAALLWPKEFSQRKLIKVVLVMSTVVCVFGLLQYVLPKDLMSHFGYSISRGVKPVFFIDDKPDLPRIMSTIRDPNSLGGYLVLPITLMTYLWFKAKARQRQVLGGLLLLHVLALFLTFSRSAILALGVSLFAMALITLRERLLLLAKRFWPAGLTAIVVLAGVVYLGRDQYFIQNVVFHSDESTTSALDSNEYHASFIQLGLRGISRQPFGHGPGTAGIVSIQNKDGGLLTENYFVQIGYEVGVVGLLVFCAALFYSYQVLRAQKPSPLQVALLASFWGYICMAMLTHLWTNEAIAAQWWLLAGLVMGGVNWRPKKAGAESLADARGTKARR